MKISTIKFGFAVLLLGVLFSCSSKKQNLINEYRVVNRLIENHEYDSLLTRLDEPSLEFINFMTDPSSFSFQSMMRFGQERDLTLFTSVYNHVFATHIDSSDSKHETFFTYLMLERVPMFDLFAEPKLLEDKTNVGNNDNYVVVGTKVADKAYITSKMRFTESLDGTYQLDLLSLLKMREKLLRQQFSQYKRRIRFDNSRDINSSDDYIRYFVQEMDLDENRLKEISYRR